MSNPRQVVISYTVTYALDIPEDFPVTAKEIQEVAAWKTNDCTDGRQPYDTETLLRAAAELARWNMSEAIFHHYCRRVEKAFPPGPEGWGWRHIEGRNKLIARCEDGVNLAGPIRNREVGIDVHISPATVMCPGCGNETPAHWRECSCTPCVLLPGLELRPGEARTRRLATPEDYPPRDE